MENTNKNSEKKESRAFTPPRLRREGKLPVITAGSGDLGTPDP